MASSSHILIILYILHLEQSLVAFEIWRQPSTQYARRVHVEIAFLEIRESIPSLRSYKPSDKNGKQHSAYRSDEGPIIKLQPATFVGDLHVVVHI